MPTMITDIAEQLIAERKKITDELRTLERAIIRKKQELKRLSAALKALGGKAAGRGIATEQVIALIEEALRDGRSLTTEQIQKAVEVGIDGIPRNIMHRRLKEALRDERFRLEDGVWALVPLPQ